MSGSNSSDPASAALPEPHHGLSFTVHSQPEPAPADLQRRAGRGRWTMLLVLAICAAPVIASYFTFFVLKPRGGANYAELITPLREMPADLRLADLEGRPVAPASLRGQWLFVVVADAACDARCESLLLIQRQLREALGREKTRIDKVLLVTGGATLSPALREALARPDAVTVLRVDAADLGRWLAPAAGQSIGAHVYLVDPMAMWMMRTPPQPDASKFKRDVERLLRASASWDTPGR